MRATRPALAAVALLLSTLTAARAQLAVLETDDLRLVYIDPTETYLVPHAASCFENSMRFHRMFFDYDPWEKLTVFLTDFADSGNAGATAAPRDFVSVSIAPMDLAYETYPSNERLNTLFSHELVHIVAMDKAAPPDRFFRGMFGGKVQENAEDPESILYAYLTTPRADAPRWYHEGLAVFVETWMAGGIGRAQGSWDEMVFRSKVLDDTPFYDPLGLASQGTKTDFQMQANSYLYGTRFLSYLTYQYGPQKLIDWVSRRDGTRAYYAAQFRQVYGMRLEDAWQDWIEWEREFQRRNLDAIQEYPTTPYRDLSPHGLGSVSRAHHDAEDGILYAAVNYPGVVPHIAAISLKDGSIRRIRDVKGPSIYSVASLAYDPAAKMLYYTTDNNALRDLVSLDPRTGRRRVLLKDARIGELVFDRADRSIWGIRVFNGLSTLVQVPHPYEEWKQIHTWPYGTVVYDLDVSPDGKRLSASVGRINGQHSLQVFEVEKVLAGDLTPVAEVDFGTTIPSSFVFTPDGRYLFGSSYYTGVSNIIRFDPEAGKFDVVTNCETGMFRPIPREDGKLIVFRYTGEGFVPAEIDPEPLEDVNAITFLGRELVERYPVLREWKNKPPSSVDLDALVLRQEEYHPIRDLRLESVYPVIEGYKNFGALGVRANFSDSIFLNTLTMTASYTGAASLPENQRGHLELRYKRHDWTAFFKWNDANFYDLFGPTKVSRKGTALGFGYNRYLIYDQPRTLQMWVGATAYAGLDTLPDYQNVPSPSSKLFTTGFRLDFSDRRASIAAVDYEKGLTSSLYVQGSWIPDQDVIPSAVATFDFGTPVGIPNSSFWVRTAAGAAVGNAADPYANLFFGGFGNNWVDHGTVKRYREWYAFPGVPLNAIGGQTFGKVLLEWNLPPAHFRNLGSPGFYLTWMRSSLFATGLFTALDDREFRSDAYDVGTQLDFRLTALNRLQLTLSLGYAVAFAEGLPSQDEFMFSLSILH